MRFASCAIACWASLACLTMAVGSSSAATYEEYLTALGKRESGNKYDIANRFGYLGRFQFGEAALVDCQLYLPDGSRRNDWISEWSEEAQRWPVNNKDQFLATPPFQDFAILRFNILQWSAIVRLGLTRFIGQEVGGVTVTKSGMLGGAHLLGPGNLKKFLASNGATLPRDGNGTPITEYIELFADYDVPFH